MHRVTDATVADRTTDARSGASLVIWPHNPTALGFQEKENDGFKFGGHNAYESPLPRKTWWRYIAPFQWAITRNDTGNIKLDLKRKDGRRCVRLRESEKPPAPLPFPQKNGHDAVTSMFEEECIGFARIHRVTDAALSRFIQQTAMQLSEPGLKRYPSFRFPGSMPVTVEDRHRKALRAGQYMFTSKADGVRAQLVLFKYFLAGDWQRMCATVQRDGTCHAFSICVSETLHENGGSLFDCELVGLASSRACLLIFDCYACSGGNQRHLSLSRRLHKCDSFVQCMYSERPSDPLVVRSKPYYAMTSDHLDDALSFMDNRGHYLDYDTDGIVIVPCGPAATATGTDEAQFKMKAHHTIDLAYVQDDEDGRTCLASLDENDDTYVVKQDAVDDIPGAKIGDIIECLTTLVSGDYEIVVFKPIRVRADKTSPNTERVIARTLQTIRDGVSVQSLFAPDRASLPHIPSEGCGRSGEPG